MKMLKRLEKYDPEVELKDVHVGDVLENENGAKFEVTHFDEVHSEFTARPLQEKENLRIANKNPWARFIRICRKASSRVVRNEK